jgi:hypothetical protein
MLVENDIGADERGHLIEQAGGLYGGANPPLAVPP